MNYITLCLSDAGGKLEANWLGPYTVKTVGPNHQAVLEKDGVLLKHKVNFGQQHLCVMRNSPVASTIRLQCVDTCEPALNVVS